MSKRTLVLTIVIAMPFAIVGCLITLAPWLLSIASERDVRAWKEKDERARLDHLRAGETVFILSEEEHGADEWMRRLVPFHQLEELTLEHTDISDSGIESIGRLPHLRKLVINAGRVNDQGIEYLKDNQSIETLVLDRTSVTGNGLRVLRTLPNLRHLVFDEDSTDGARGEWSRAVISSLKTLRQLTTLEIGGDWVTDEVLHGIKQDFPCRTVKELHKDDLDRWYYQK